MSVQFKLRGAVQPAHRHAEQMRTPLQELLPVPPGKLLSGLVVIRRQNHPRLRLLHQPPGGERFRKRHALAVLGRRFHNQDVIGVPRPGFQKRLDLIGQEGGEPGGNPEGTVDEG